MSPNTAICFIASGVALLLASWRDAPIVVRRIGMALSIAVIIASGFILSVRSGLGGPELSHAASTWVTRGRNAGLMAPTTASCFLLLSVALLAGDRGAERRRQRWSRRLALVVVFATFTVLLGYIYQVTALYRYREEGMAVHTATLLLILGIGTLCLHPDRGFVSRFAQHSVAGVLFRRLLAGGVVLLLPLGGLVAAGQRAGWYSPAIQNALVSAGGILILAFLVWRSTENIAAAERARALAEERLRRQYEETKSAYAEAEAAGHAKDQFLAMLSHELRTPLTPALLAARELARESELRPGAAESLRIIERNIELQARLVDDLLDVTRIRSGKLHLQMNSCDIHDVVLHALKVCAADVKAKQLKVSVTLEARQHIVQGDCARLHQVFWNLLKNAVKFTPPGGSIQVRSSDDDNGKVRIGVEDNGKVRIGVEDNGIGIAPDLLGRVFDPFEQGTDATPKKLGGLGLGLAITKAITEAHQGTVAVRSAGKGHGANFEVLFPAALPATVSDEDNPPCEASGAPKQPLRILLVEDHADTRAMLKKLLERRAHVVFSAGDISSAVRIAESTEVDLLLTDLNLPDGDGRTVLKQVHREDGRVGSVVMTGDGSEDGEEESLAAGFDAHLTKPISLEHLESAIARATAKSR